jgi:hypothetical protein
MSRETLTPRQLVALYEGDLVGQKIRAFLRGKPHIIGVYLFPNTSQWELTLRCISCGKVKHVVVEHDDLLAWTSGTFIQHIWPDIDLREQLISGLDAECFDAL